MQYTFGMELIIAIGTMADRAANCTFCDTRKR